MRIMVNFLENNENKKR